MPSGVYKRTKEEIQRIRNLRKDKVPWNKGLSKLTSEILKLNGLKISIRRKQRVEPIRTQEWKDNIGLGNKGKIGMCGDKNPNWKGGIYKNRKYLMKNIGRNKKQFLHRYIMERYFKRPLKKSEVVHHIDGNPLNNNLNNLYLFNNQLEHNRYEGKVRKYSKQLLTNRITLEQFQDYCKLK